MILASTLRSHISLRGLQSTLTIVHGNRFRFTLCAAAFRSLQARTRLYLGYKGAVSSPTRLCFDACVRSKFDVQAALHARPPRLRGNEVYLDDNPRFLHVLGLQIGGMQRESVYRCLLRD